MIRQFVDQRGFPHDEAFILITHVSLLLE
jgi:hypothetical protein